MEPAMFDKHKASKTSEPRMVEPELAPRTSPQGSPAFAAAGKTAVIGPGIVIDGDISGSENLVIEGKVKGRILLASHEVTVGQSGEVNADISAKVIRVSGKIKGDLSGKEKVIISSTGNVHGNIVAPRMLLEDGAVFKGSIDMDPREPGSQSVAQSAAQSVAQPVAQSVAQSAAQSAARVAAPTSAVATAAKAGTSPEPNATPNPSSKAPDLALKSG
jgi:cytoskeletal protein CcmA (bactofilin family)